MICALCGYRSSAKADYCRVCGSKLVAAVSFDMRAVAVFNKESGTWHIATQNQDTGVLLTPEGCNLDDAERLEMYPELPDFVRAIDLCKRCHPTVTDR